MGLDEKWAAKRKIYDNMARVLGKHIRLQREWSLLEFGIGKWGFAKFYQERVRTVYGVDIEDYSKHHPERIKFLISGGEDIPLPDNSIDIAVSHSVLEHVGNLTASIGEINRVVKPGGYLFLTVSPLYYSSYGAHINENGKRVENWDHLIPSSPHYLIENPIPGAKTIGHDLNKLTSSKFLAAVGTVPWSIINYELTYEDRPVPDEVDRAAYSHVDLVTKGFRFIGRKNPNFPAKP